MDLFYEGYLAGLGFSNPSGNSEFNSRMEVACDKLLQMWKSEAIPKLAIELGQSEESLFQELASIQFQQILLKKLGMNTRVYTHDPLRDNYLSKIRLAAISTENPIRNLNRTLKAIKKYVEAIKESAALDVRFVLASTLQSKDRSLTGEVCEICGGKMRLIKSSGFDSYFIGCANYPDCTNTQKMTFEIYKNAQTILDRLNKDDLTETIDRLVCERAESVMLLYSEDATRAEFIDPILKAIGWDTYVEKDTNVMKNKGIGTKKLKVDYLLHDENGNPFAIIEAKKFSDSIEHHSKNFEQHCRQLQRYMEIMSLGLGALTNGHEWQIFSSIKGINLYNEMSVDLLSNRGKQVLEEFYNWLGNKRSEYRTNEGC